MTQPIAQAKAAVEKAAAELKQAQRNLAKLNFDAEPRHTEWLTVSNRAAAKWQEHLAKKQAANA